MTKDLAIVVVHGMGETEPDYHFGLRSELRDRLGDSLWERVSWNAVYYQDLLQDHQRRYMDACKRTANVDWVKLRKFLLFGFSDAGTMQYRAHETDSMYHRIQEIIHDTLIDALDDLEDPRKPVVIVAHSLGCQVISNYIWDAQKPTANLGVGVFRADIPDPIGRSGEHAFLRLKTLEYLFTSGCNIPIFVAGLPKEEIVPIKVNANGWSFSWQNYYDPDDVLGWPLKPLSDGYRKAVTVDKDINVGGPLSSWTPLSHNEYWEDRDFLKPLEAALRRIL